MSIEAISETDQILRVQADWITHEQNGHQDAVLEYCSDDVVWLVPELGAVYGKDAIRQWLSEQEGPPIGSIELSEVRIEVSGLHAVKTANFETTILADNGTVETFISGTHLWVLRKSMPERRWQVTHLSWVCK